MAQKKTPTPEETQSAEKTLATEVTDKTPIKLKIDEKDYTLLGKGLRDPNDSSKVISRKELAENTEKYMSVLQDVLEIKGQNVLIPVSKTEPEPEK